MGTEKCGSCTNSAPSCIYNRYEVRYMLRGTGIIRLAGWDADPEAESVIEEITDDWARLWIIDTKAKPPEVIHERSR